MERLTKRIGNSVAYSEFNSNNSDGCYEMMDNCLHKLAEYKDAEEQGLLVKIECRCKDCVHWSDGVAGATEHVKLCTVGGYMVGENGYCVYGEQALAEMKEV